MKVNYEVRYRILCTKSPDSRFDVGKIYLLGTHGELLDEHGNFGACNSFTNFKDWYGKCNWRDYVFELMPDVDLDGTDLIARYLKQNMGRIYA
jgi:hypothetical protein